MRRLRGRRGVVLVQVMVLAMVLGSIAAMLVQWQFGRYVTTYRVENFTRGRMILQAAYNQKAVTCFMDPSPTSCFGSGFVDILDPVFGTCRVSFLNCNSTTTPGSAYDEVCAQFDPCNCSVSPCS